MSRLLKPCRKIQGTILLPGDKSISHRALILSAIAEGKTKIKNFSFSKDCLTTLKALRVLGVKINKDSQGNIFVWGRGLNGFKKNRQSIYLAESGTSMRILTGLLSAQSFSIKLTAHRSLCKRPMSRVVIPLRLMGAKIKGRVRNREIYAPLQISPARLKPLNWKMTVPSAQVKSAILLAGLYTKGKTRIYEPVKSRDHTERMLKYFGADITLKGKNIYIRPSRLVSPRQIYVPADISSASFFIVLACLLRDSRLRIKNLCINPSRAGVLEVLKRMGAPIKIIRKQRRLFEPIADLVVQSCKLKAVRIDKNKIPSLIDELPILMVAASLAKGKSIFEGVEELKVKETDRIRSMLWNLSRMGVKIERRFTRGRESILIQGGTLLKGAKLKSFSDHRTAMSMIVAALLADSPSYIDDVSCINKSFPTFLRILKKITCPEK